jgi:putative cell wall-binding protein
MKIEKGHRLYFVKEKLEKLFEENFIIHDNFKLIECVVIEQENNKIIISVRIDIKKDVIENYHGMSNQEKIEAQESQLYKEINDRKKILDLIKIAKKMPEKVKDLKFITYDDLGNSEISNLYFTYLLDTSPLKYMIRLNTI